MTQCRVIDIEWPNWEPLNYILFSVYREDIRKLEEEIKKLKTDLWTVIDERDNALKKIKQLEERLDNKEKVNKQLREEIKDLNKMMLFETELEK